jgi:hypothetical protein
MHAATIDTGATISVLRAFGPPDVVELDPFAGNASAELHAEGFWTVITAVSLKLVTAVAVADRLPRLTWRALEQVPFAQALAPFALQASKTGQVTFAVDVQQAGALNAATIIAPMPELVLLPGWSLTVDVVNGAAGDAVSGVRCYRQRYKLIVVDELIED